MKKQAKVSKPVRAWAAIPSFGTDPMVMVPQSGRRRMVMVWGEDNIFPVLIADARYYKVVRKAKTKGKQ